MKKITFLLLLVFASSCKKEDENPINAALECLGSAEIPFALSTCEDVLTNEFFCDITALGEFVLDDISKEYMTYACDDIGDKITYVNEDGDELDLEIIDQRYQETTATYNSGNVCQSDSSLYDGICLGSEVIRLILQSATLELELMVEIKTIPETFSVISGGVGDILQISRKTGVNLLTIDFKAVLSQRTLSYDKTFSQEVFESIDILGEEFRDVISNDVSMILSPTYKYYYSKTEGLIAFQDDAGMLWKRK